MDDLEKRVLKLIDDFKKDIKENGVPEDSLKISVKGIDLEIKITKKQDERNN